MPPQRLSAHGRPLAAAVLSCALMLAGCGSASTAPADPAPPQPLRGIHSLSGRVLASVTGEAVSGATVTVSQGVEASEVITDQEGRFHFPAVPAGLISVALSRPGYITRTMSPTVSSSRADVAWDIIRNEAPFKLAFYREFARQGYDGPSMSTLNPWQQAPSFYVMTRTFDTNQPVDRTTLEGVKRVLIGSVPELTGYRWQINAYEEGNTERPATAGWIRVLFEGKPFSPDRYILGESTRGPTGPEGSGWIRLVYDPYVLRTSEPCESVIVRVAEHEVVHAMGFAHTADTPKVFQTPDCSGVGRPIEALHHASIVYSRPRGNRDIDDDPSAAMTVQSASSAPPPIGCPFSLFWRPD